MIAAETKSTTTAGPRSPKRGPSQDHAFAAPGWHSAETSAKASESCADIENARLWHGRQSGAGVHPPCEAVRPRQSTEDRRTPRPSRSFVLPGDPPCFRVLGVVHRAQRGSNVSESTFGERGNQGDKPTLATGTPAGPLPSRSSDDASALFLHHRVSRSMRAACKLDGRPQVTSRRRLRLLWRERAS